MEPLGKNYICLKEKKQHTSIHVDQAKTLNFLSI